LGFESVIVGELTGDLGLNPMHILLYPRDCSSRKNHVNRKKFGIQGVYQPFV